MRNDQVELTNEGLGAQTDALKAALENLYATGSGIAFSNFAASNDDLYAEHEEYTTLGQGNR